MTVPKALRLDDRSIISVAGEDRLSFLQGLVSNDVRQVTDGGAIYAALLTPQGKYLFDFFIVGAGDALWLDCEAARAEALARRLGIYRLRARVTITPMAHAISVVAGFGTGAAAAVGLAGADPGTAAALSSGFAFLDPRLPAAGIRCLLPSTDVPTFLAGHGFGQASRDDFDRHRLSLGLPDGSRDLIVERSLLLECGFDELNGVNWNKGCYVGQEVTARSKHRGLIRKRLVPARITGPLPAPGTPIRQAERTVGEIRSGVDGLALALLQLDALALAQDGGPDSELWAGESRVRADVPTWVHLVADRPQHPGLSR
ncbi:putative Aminomethyltransferase [uncultured Defluviicoccus sp.]|uniref:Putative Aminomethyltransferase n=1 Tax=metagenome TaxID=256318 RepID=A0A380TBY7_9ZZZZ|nr:putative Aminomethyltransferase [uncultured Defluviicoccus sp.]